MRVPKLSSRIGGGAWRIRTADPLPARLRHTCHQVLPSRKSEIARVVECPGFAPRISLFAAKIAASGHLGLAIQRGDPAVQQEVLTLLVEPGVPNRVKRGEYTVDVTLVGAALVQPVGVAPAEDWAIQRGYRKTSKSVAQTKVSERR